MKEGQTSANGHRGKDSILCLGIVLILALGIFGWWSQVAGKAQANSGKQDQSSDSVKVLVHTSSGNIVTTSVEPPNVQTISNLDRLLQKYPGTWKVEIEKGVVKNLKPTTPILITSSPKDFSLSLLSEFSNAFGISSEEITYLMEFNLRQRRVVEYRQVIGGVPVEYSFLTFSVQDSQLEQVTSRLYPAVSSNLKSVIPSLKRESAFDIASLDSNDNLRGSSSQKVNYRGDLVVLPEGTAYFLTWKVIVDAPGSLDSYTYYIDANTGRVIKKYTNVESQTSLAPVQEPTALRSKEEASAVLRKRLTTVESQTAASEPQEKRENKAVDTPTLPQTALTQSAGTWQTILSENFDTLEFPYSPWRVFDNNGSTGGELYWDDQNCVSHDPSWSLWAADGGTNRLNACTDNYASDMDSWVVYGPFDLSNSTDGLLDFHYNNVSELNYDYFKWMASVDGTHFSGYQVSGDSNGWQYQSLDFKNVPTLGNITGRSQVWIAFIFTSDSSVVSGKGAFVDDVAIKKMLSSSCTGVSGHVGGHIYGKNQYELQLKDFKDMKVVLNKSFATDSYTATDSVGNYSSSACSDYIRFELEGYGASNFLKVRDCNDGNCPFGGDLLTSQDFSFASQVNFDWNVDAENKKEVNVFWHVNEMHDWYRSLLGQDLMNYQMQAYVDYVDVFALKPACSVGRIQAFYNGSDRNLYFCPSDVSRESDVIYHEYTHGVVHHIPNYALPYQDESGALDEGFADYFAAVKNADPIIGEGLPAQYQRSITAAINYSDKCNAETSTCRADQYFFRSTGPDPDKNDYGFVHHNSVVPSGALWNLRQNQGLSGSYVDRLVFDTLILRKPLTFTELLNGLIGEDGASHEAQIRAAFATRGVMSSTCTYALDPTSRIFIASASTGSFNVSTAANCSWTAQSNVSWLTTNSSGSGNGTVSYSVAANTGNSRTGAVSVGGQSFTVFQSAGNGNGCPSTTVSVGQTISATLDTGCVFTGTSRYVDPYDFAGTAGQQIIIAMSSTAFDTYLFLDGPNNQTIAQDDDGGGGTNSRIPASSGSFTLPATGTYRFWATSYSPDGTTGSTGPYVISLLSATSCSYSINPTSQSIAAAANSNSFNISAPMGCTWTALSNASWIVTGSSGSGNGTINYSVAANTGAARTGTISVGGQLFTVTQSASTWEPVVLTAGQSEIKTWTSSGRTYVYVKLLFPNAGYRVANWAQAVRSANDFSADAAVEKFNGASVQSVTTTAQIYDLGPLAASNYTFTFKNSGTVVKSQAFAVSSTTPPANPIDNPREFVKQQYRDFLNREADQTGENFWTDNITKCTDPARRQPGQTEAQCTTLQRAITSGAFFLSPEFQYTGYYVLRMYKGALGRQPKLSEFIPDAQFVGAGILINSQLSAAKINQNKSDFAAQFVNCTDATKYRCAEFKAIYDGLNNQQYVDKLFLTTGVNASASDRTALVNGLNGGTETRASVLQKVVDGIVVIGEGNQTFTTTYGQAFYTQESNRAFVLLEYFGYMKRDPDDAGYAFWLGKLNQFGGNFVNAEMVLAFISSPEYRARFGQP